MKAWKGRFTAGLHPDALRFSTSLPVDRRLYEEDIEGSLAHARMLARQRIISFADARKITAGLKSIREEIRRDNSPIFRRRGTGGRFVAEDIHMAIEARLIELVGEAGGRLHTARSRNDQIALDERLYLRRATNGIIAHIHAFQKSLLKFARMHRDVLMPGYTHLQRAQPILFAHHLLAYLEMLERDKHRFRDCGERASWSPLGAGALAGSSFPVDLAGVARDLHLSGILGNSIDAVSDRDAILEFLSACAITMMHMSRLSEELVLWSSREWHFIEIGDAFATGSSIMPQKKNPDMAELIRGKTGRVYGDLMALLTTMKGLPLSYNRDLQEDKEPLFDAADTLASSINIMTLMIPTITVNADRFEAELRDDFTAATDLADYLVRKGMPFRSAHAVVGGIVRHCVEKGIGLQDLSPAVLRSFSPMFRADVLDLLDPRTGIKLKKSAGSTSPVEVGKALRRWERQLRGPQAGIAARK
ncbi:MAG: argininosuccinate lyase [Bacteroidota bacterium]